MVWWRRSDQPDGHESLLSEDEMEGAPPTDGEQWLEPPPPPPRPPAYWASPSDQSPTPPQRPLFHDPDETQPDGRYDYPDAPVQGSAKVPNPSSPTSPHPGAADPSQLAAFEQPPGLRTDPLNDSALRGSSPAGGSHEGWMEESPDSAPAAAPAPMHTPVQHVTHAPSPGAEPMAERRTFMADYTTALNEAMQIEGALGIALVDSQSGMALATAGSPPGLDLNVAAAGNSNVIQAKMRTMADLGIRETIEDILITLDSQYHVIRTFGRQEGMFLYLVLDKSRSNLAMARFRLAKVEKELDL